MDMRQTGTPPTDKFRMRLLRLRKALKLFAVFFKYRARERMEYRAAFTIGAVSQMIAYAANYLVVWMLLDRFGTINGWRWPEVAFLYSAGLFAYALGAAFSWVQMRDLEGMVRDGTFDTILVKPLNPYFYFVASTFNNAYIAHFLLSGAVLAWSLTRLDIRWSWFEAVYFAVSVLSGALIFAGILTAIGALSFTVVRIRFLFSLFQELREYISYPITVYHWTIQALLMFLVPMAFINFVPASFLFGETVPLLGDVGYWLVPLVGPLVFWIGYRLWMRGVNRYQGAGG